MKLFEHFSNRFRVPAKWFRVVSRFYNELKIKGFRRIENSDGSIFFDAVNSEYAILPNPVSITATPSPGGLMDPARADHIHTIRAAPFAGQLLQSGQNENASDEYEWTTTDEPDDLSILIYHAASGGWVPLAPPDAGDASVLTCNGTTPPAWITYASLLAQMVDTASLTVCVAGEEETKTVLVEKE